MMNYSQSTYPSSLRDQIGQTLLPFPIRFEEALKAPLLVKVDQLQNLINEALSINIKEIQQRFVVLVEDIFSFSYSFTSYNSDWKLRETSRENNRREFEIIFQFLHPNGMLFKLIRELMVDPNNRFDFPIVCLPPSTRASFENGQFPQLYSNKINSSSSKCISLNAFEFYLFHFAYFVTVPSKRLKNLSYNSLNSNNSVLYYKLLAEYLATFLPTIEDRAAVNDEMSNSFMHEGGTSLWKSLSSTTSNILHLGGSKQHETARHSMATPLRGNNMTIGNNSLAAGVTPLSNSPLLAKSPLVASKILSLNKFTPTLNNSVNEGVVSDTIGSVIYKCETMLNILTEIWLNSTFDEGRQQKQSQQQTNIGHFNLTVEQMKATRIFIKHLHYFANSAKKKSHDMNSSLSAQYNSGGMIASSIVDPIDELKRNLWSGKYSIQKRLYQFFRQVFDRWPNDLSFRFPLETWLTYIQPYRYNSLTKQTSMIHEKSIDMMHIDPNEWKRFVSENLLFFTHIFRQVIGRITNMLGFNLGSSSHLLFRVTKVFAQDIFVDTLKEAELGHLNGADVAFSLNRMSPTNSHNLLSSNFKAHGSPYKNNMMLIDFVEPEAYVSIFSPNYRDQMISLLQKLIKLVCTLEQQQKTTKEKVNNLTVGVLNSFANFFELKSGGDSFASPTTSFIKADQMDAAKMKQYLEHSIKFLSKIFDIQEQCIETMQKNEMTFLKSYQKAEEEKAFNRHGGDIYEVVNGVPRLSEAGRNMMLNGMLKHPQPPITQGNPDERSAQSCEFAFLVKLFLWLSILINKRCAEHFATYYQSKTFYGSILRHVLSPPVKYVYYHKEANNFSTLAKIETLPARLNMRVFASKEYLAYSLIIYLFAYVAFKISLTCFMFFSFVSYASYVLTQSTLSYMNSFNCSSD